MARPAMRRRMSPVRRLVLGSVAIVLAACEGQEPIGPTPPDEGVIVYIHSHFVGTSQQINQDIRNFENVEGPCVVSDDNGSTASWNDCISSVRVLPGWQATLYRDREFRGSFMMATEDITDLRQRAGPCDGSFNDCVSSIRVSRR
jgi:Peptidase inhibitor family I36